jgi:hypothetical protein
MVSDLKWSPSLRTTFEIALIHLCGRKVKVEPVPLVVPDFVKKQMEFAKTKVLSTPEIVKPVSPAPVPAPEAEPVKEEPVKEEPVKEEVKEPEKEEPESGSAVEQPAEPVAPVVPSEPSDPEDLPMENQIDLFSAAPVMETPKKDPEPEVSPSPAPAPAADNSSPLLGLLSNSFLDDLTGTGPTITHYKEAQEEKEEKIEPTTSLVQAMEGQELLKSKEPELTEGADLDAIWESIYSQVIGENYMMYANLCETRLLQENEKVYILFDNSYTKESLKELTGDPLYKKIRNDILTVIPGTRHVYVATPKMLDNLRNRQMSEESMLNAPEKEKSKLEGYLDKAEQLGIDIHFGDD